MLDTKTLKEETIKECRENETWLKNKVENFAPDGTTCNIEELSVNDTAGDEYIFCEVTITCNKRKHHFNYYAGPHDVSLVERFGGNKGERADGDKLGKTFEIEFYIPSKDDMEDFEEFLEKLADYAPKKLKAQKEDFNGDSAVAKYTRGLRFERDRDSSEEPTKIFVDTIAMFRGAWVTVSKHYTRELEHRNLRGRVYGAFYTVTLKLVNGDLVNFVKQGKNPDTGAPIGMSDADFEFNYRGVVLHLHLKNEGEDGKDIYKHKYTAYVRVDSNGTEICADIAPSRLKFKDGTDGKPITFGVNANLWPMGKAPSCHELLEAWPAYPLSMTATSLI